MILRWLRWSVMRLCSGKFAKLASFILSQFWALRSAACPCSCSLVMYGRLIQYSFSASRSSCFSVLRFICQVICRGRRYFPIHCFPGIPFRRRVRVRNMMAKYFCERWKQLKLGAAVVTIYDSKGLWWKYSGAYYVSYDYKLEHFKWKWFLLRKG